METSRFETKKLVRVVSISNRYNFCNQRLLNIYSHLYLRVLSPLRPYIKQYQAVRVVKQNIFSTSLYVGKIQIESVLLAEITRSVVASLDFCVRKK